MEHSERGDYVTRVVCEWIANDGKYFAAAKTYAEANALRELERLCTRVIRRAAVHEAAGWVRCELAANDFRRIDWRRVAEALDGE